jgi:two-component system phosphate regulon sensor histidine kinase PhoR
LESKDVKITCLPSDIQTVISSVVLMKKQQMEELKHSLIMNIPSNLPLLMMDTQRMEQVFLNLLDNAVKFTPAGGKIEIKVSLDSKYLRVDVVDNGRGISSEDIKRIFERFFRSDKSRSHVIGGTGLGLSIVKHIVEAHQGKIEVESTLGCGCRFSVFLPVAML